MKPLYLKTYGRAKRLLPAWISPEDRRQVFDSSTSTEEEDVSVFEPKKRVRKASVAASRKATRPPPKKKAALCLTEKSSNDENIPPVSHPLPDRPSTRARIIREKKTAVGAFPSTKRGALVHLTETSTDEENMPLSPQPQPPQKRKRTRSRPVFVPEVVQQRQKCQQVSMTSDGAEDSRTTTKCQNTSAQTRRNSYVPPSSVSRFVTRRRCTVAAKPRVLKGTFILDSSDDFAPGAFDRSQDVWKPRRRRVPASFLVSSAENSVNVANFATNPFREISLNESADHSLRPYSRKPIFCSTPSAGPHIKVKPLPIDDPSSTSHSTSLGCTGGVSIFQEDLDSPPPCPAPHMKLHPEASRSVHSEQEPHLGHHEEPSVDLFTQPKRSSSSEDASRSEGTKSKSLGELPSLNLLSTEDSESSSHFVSAAGGLEWLIEALKEKCLTECCTVRLERLNNVIMTQLCSQTTYSSCLEDSSLVHSQENDEHPVSADSVQTIDLSQPSDKSFALYLSTNITGDVLQSVSSFESSECVVKVNNSQSANNTPPEDSEKSASDHTDSSVGFIMDTQVAATSPVQILLSDGEAVAVNDTLLTRNCTVELQNMTLSQVTVQRLKRDDKSASEDVCKSEHDNTHHKDREEHLTCPGVTTGTTVESVGQSINCSSTLETEALTSMLKTKCLLNNAVVVLEKVTMSQLKGYLQLKGKRVKSSTDTSSEEQTNQLCLSDTSDPNEDTSAEKISMKRGSTSSDDKEKAAVRNIPHRRSKTSQAPKDKKRRSTSANRPGTTRKACVSGLSVSRWKSKDAASTRAFRSRAKHTDSNKLVDCSITELISTQHKQPQELLSTMNFSTPVRASRLNLSSLLSDLSPSTHTWSRLKAALSVHRKGIVHTPRSLCQTPRSAGLADVSQDLFATPFRTPLPKHFQSQLMSCNISVVCEGADLSDAEKVYAECGQQHPLPWDQCILPEQMKCCVKIGEGTFGEVFSTTNASGDTVALKIIPVEGSEKVNGEDQKTLGEILHEIIISKELSSLKEKQQNQTHGFIGLNNLHCVQGCYPADFLNAWDKFDNKKGSENDRPDFFEKDQLFIILEFEFGGVDLENSSGTLASLVVAKSILHQVTAALAVAEQELHFEHRDLHWGNVLVKTTKQKKSSFLLNGSAHSLEVKGVLVRIIDYSLSRLEIDDLTVSCDISADEELFMGQGDYQFDIYRLMRQENGNNWTNYHPHTNVLWLHYLCSKLLSMKYRGSGGRGAKDMRKELTRFHDNVLQYGSATETLQNCPMFQ